MLSERRQWLLVAAAGVAFGTVAGLAVAGSLAIPDGSGSVRALALCAGSAVLGLAVLGSMVQNERRPAVSPDDVWRTIAAVGGLWLVLASIDLVRAAAATAGVPVTGLGVDRFVEYLTDSGAGRVDGGAWVCVLACTLVAAVAYRRSASWSTAPVLVAAGLALIARPVTGHMAQQPLGSLLNAVHVLAAAIWFGVLLALALTVRGRGAWAELLPRYSQLALWCVISLVVSGVVDGAVRLGSVSALLGTGYGRILLAKAVVLVALLLLARVWRRRWVPGAASHRVSAEESLRNAVLEVCAMSVALGLAAALATTG
ncbi:CopD family protein [Rhodococcus sp. Z13]|uniref:CopD family protein n=1 Tax=Rhodococcus sacchari TaxID=2962047 RepID=A0ACD4DGB5_9NOCA|nr:CopD family protein [Rhodococcus sp. Z13]UYP19125.1 CopD family protein [Rhodococcus sp. Z13]